MKVLLVAGLFYPSKLGGPANTLYWLSKALVKRGIDLSVVTEYSHIDDGVVNKDCWNDVNDIQVFYCSHNGKLSFRVVSTAIKKVKSSDIIMLSSVCYLPNSLVAIYAKFRKKKIIWSPRGELLNSALNGNLAKLAHFKFLKFVLGKSVTFHATSEDEILSIQKVFGQFAKVVMIPNYMELPEKCIRNENTEKYFLYVGRIAPIKALDRLLTGLSISKLWRCRHYSFKFVGPVEEQFKEYYQKLLTLVNQYDLKDSVQFVGPIHGEKKFQVYADARCLFLVSNSENFGNVVIESLSQGTPVVTSMGTPWRRMKDVKAGYWIENSPECIAESIDNILEMPDSDYKTMRENALSFSKEFDVFSNIDRWIKVLNG